MSVSSSVASPVIGLSAATSDGETDPPVDLATFFDVSVDMLVIREISGPVVKVSPSWQTSLGYTPEEMRGVILPDLVHPEDHAGTLGSAVEVETRAPDAPVKGFTNRYRHKAGHYRTLEWRAQRFGDRIYAVARDVTDRVAAEQALVEAKAAAESASRAKSDFLANMSHEIRTPLNGVIGIVDALSRTAMTPEQAGMVELIRSSGETLERLVSDILDVSKIEAGRLDIEVHPFDLGEALAPCVDLMRARAAEKGLSFDVIQEIGAKGAFLGDSTRIRQILTNLLSNAIKFTAAGGVTLRIGLDDGGETPRLTLEIEDTGVGFEADKGAWLFDRFSQADNTITRRFGGTGLGLSICRSLAELMGGGISATSEPGVGSRFRVEVPLERDAAEAAPTSATPPAEAALREGRLRVLLAEDHPINQRVVQLILDGVGAELTIVEDGAQAVKAFMAQTFDVVLMDMQMPGMDGLTATRAIRAREDVGLAEGHTPVVILSANAMAEHRAQALAAGADLHVAKPITAASLLAGIEEALTFAAADDQTRASSAGF